MANNKRPSATLKLQESGKELTMTYLVFNDILRMVGQPDEAANLLLTSQDTRDFVIRRLLTDSKESVEKEEELITSGEVDVDIFELDEIIGWVLEHVTYFFMRTGKKVQEKTKNLQEELEEMTAVKS